MMFYRTLTLLKGFVEQRRIYSLSAEVETEQICTNKKANVGVRLKSGDTLFMMKISSFHTTDNKVNNTKESKGIDVSVKLLF